MSNKPLPWPTHGKAVEARNSVADRQWQIINEVAELQSLVESGEITRLDIMIFVTSIHKLASESMMILIEQGAPYLRPGGMA